MKKQEDILDVLQQKGLLTEEEANSKRTEMKRSFPEYFTGADFNKLSEPEKIKFIEKFIEKLHEYVIGSLTAKRKKQGNSIIKCDDAELYAYGRICELLEGQMGDSYCVDGSIFDNFMKKKMSSYQESAYSISQKFNRDRKQEVQE